MTYEAGWGPYGVGTMGPGMDDATRENLRQQLKDRDFQQNQVEAFLDAANKSVQMYHAERGIAENSRPADVRRQLRRLDKAAKAFFSAVEDLSALSRHYIEGGQEPKRIDDASKAMVELANATGRACALADKLPKSGRLTDYARRHLAAYIARAISNHLSKRATTTVGGLYEEILSSVIQHVDGRHADASGRHREVADVRSLMKQGLRVRIVEGPDGPIEIG